jgi:hypothetical protein
MRVRVILQMEITGCIGIIFDDHGVRGISTADNYATDGKPCCLLVSVDGPHTSPLPAFDFCTGTIVVTSPDLQSKHVLRSWEKQAKAKRFVVTPPSCPEVVYLLYVNFFISLLLSRRLAGWAKRGNGVCLSVSSLLACRNYL